MVKKGVRKKSKNLRILKENIDQLKKNKLSRFIHKEKLLKKHEHEIRTHLTFAQRAADKVTTFCGSWKFIIFFGVLMAFWITMNVYMVIYKWDPYPFILLNFVLSTVSALQAPIILMSQNRDVERDRIRTERDFMLNKKAEMEIQNMQADLDEIKSLIKGKKK